MATTTSRPVQAGPTGWTVFAGVLLLLLGTFNVIFGLTALFHDKVFTAVGQNLIVWDLASWGWIHLIVGAVMVLVSLGLFAAQGWARWLAVVFAALNAIAHVAFITVFPLWSLLLILLDVVVIYELTARWEPAAS